MGSRDMRSGHAECASCRCQSWRNKFKDITICTSDRKQKLLIALKTIKLRVRPMRSTCRVFVDSDWRAGHGNNCPRAGRRAHLPIPALLLCVDLMCVRHPEVVANERKWCFFGDLTSHPQGLSRPTSCSSTERLDQRRRSAPLLLTLGQALHVRSLSRYPVPCHLLRVHPEPLPLCCHAACITCHRIACHWDAA